MDLPTLKHVMDAYFSNSPLHTSSNFLIERKRRLSIMLGIVDELFGDAKDGLSWEEVYQRLEKGMDEKKFRETFHPDFEVEAEKLQLYKRAKHMVSALLRRMESKNQLSRPSSATKVLGSIASVPISRST